MNPSIYKILFPWIKNPIAQPESHVCMSPREWLQKSFFLCWFSSNVWVPGNEEANRLAQAATTDPHIQQSPLTRDDDVKSKVRGTARGVWKEKWRVTTSNKLREVTEDLTSLPNSICSNRYWESSCKASNRTQSYDTPIWCQEKNSRNARDAQQEHLSPSNISLQNILPYRHCTSDTFIGLTFQLNHCWRTVTPPLV